MKRVKTQIERFGAYDKNLRKRTYTFLLWISVSALTGFSERRNGVRPPEVFALSREAETFQKELHFIRIFFKSYLALDLLLVIYSLTRVLVIIFFWHKAQSTLEGVS